MLHSFILHLFHSVKLCYLACLKHLLGLIKSYNSKAEERMGEAGRQRENKQEDNLGEGVGAREGLRKDGASHPGTQRDTE